MASIIDVYLNLHLCLSKKERAARSSRQREFHPKPLTEPYPDKSGQAVKVSFHTALVIQSQVNVPFLTGTYFDFVLNSSFIPFGLLNY